MRLQSKSANPFPILAKLNKNEHFLIIDLNFIYVFY